MARHQEGNPEGAGTIISTHQKTRKDWHPTLDSTEKRGYVLDCLKDTGCPMTLRDVQQRIARTEFVFLTNSEVKYYLRKLHAEGLAVHPTPTETLAFKYQRPTNA